MAHFILGLTYLQKRRFAQATAELQQAISLSGDTPLSLAINSSQATYGQTTSISLPRRALLGVRYSF